LQEGRLRRHRTSRSEIAALFALAYSAALTLATVVLHAECFRSVGAGHHEVTVLALPHILGPAARSRARYLNTCRVRRNRIDYDGIGFAANHPDLAP